jgi:hypothetical protein
MMSNFGTDVGSAQYFCQETGTGENKESPPIGFAPEAENPGDIGLFLGESPPEDVNANNFIRPPLLGQRKRHRPGCLRLRLPVRRWQDFQLQAR